MKYKIGILASSIAVLAVISFAEVSVDDTNKVSFGIGGTVTPECKLVSIASNQSKFLNLKSRDRQHTADISLWCNTGQETTDATYASEHNGYLVNNTGERIPYDISVDEEHKGVSLNSPMTINQVVGQGIQGQPVTRSIYIEPKINGFESAGIYTDTIYITLSSH